MCDIEQLQKDAKILSDMEGKENNGRGIVCVKAIVLYMEMGDKNSAKLVFQNERDKIRSYPNIEKWLISYFGDPNTKIKNLLGLE